MYLSRGRSVIGHCHVVAVGKLGGCGYRSQGPVGPLRSTFWVWLVIFEADAVASVPKRETSVLVAVSVSIVVAAEGRSSPVGSSPASADQVDPEENVADVVLDEVLA